LDSREHQERLVDGVRRRVRSRSIDEIAAFYERHPYPPPVADLDGAPEPSTDARRIEHHRVWPTLGFREDLTILIAGCGTSQAARWATRYPQGKVIGIDVSRAGIAEHERLRRLHKLDNLELHLLPIEKIGELGERFDLIVCTGVLHHLADPAAGLAALHGVLSPLGAIRLMVYATYGRTGVSMIQEYCRRLGLGASDSEIADLVDSLREIPLGHPLSDILRRTSDFHDPDALADALLNPRERSYTVPELFELIGWAGLRFARWVRHAPYRPQCGFVSETPHAALIAELDEADQYAAVELFRGTITRHSAILHRHDAPQSLQLPAWHGSAANRFVPLRSASAIVVGERLPPGAAGALLNRAHNHSDLVMFVDESERAAFEAIDGERTVAELSQSLDPDFFQRLWWHDLVVVDASG
jgi:SAM-dependent methyltransferase